MLNGPLPEYDQSTRKYYLGDTPLTSVTAIIDKHKKPFDRDYWSKYKAKQRGVTQDVILDEWTAKGEESRKEGSRMHGAIDAVMNGKIVQSQVPLLNHLLAFKAETGLDAGAIEARIGCPMLGLVGVIDCLATSHGKTVLIDWKTGSISTKNRYGDKMLSPFASLDDCSFIHASLQLSCYERMLASHYDVTVDELWVVSVSDEGCTIYAADRIDGEGVL